MILNWEEKQPKEGDTVKVELSNWYSKLVGSKTILGVVERFASSKVVIDTGDRKMHFDTNATFYVLTK